MPNARRSGRTAGARRSKGAGRVTRRRRRSSAGSRRRGVPAWVLLLAAVIVLAAGIFAAVAMLGETGTFSLANGGVLVISTALAVVLAMAGMRAAKRRK